MRVPFVVGPAQTVRTQKTTRCVRVLHCPLAATLALPAIVLVLALIPVFLPSLAWILPLPPSLVSDGSLPANRMEPGPGPGMRPNTSSMLDHDALPIACTRLCACARPSASDTFDTETCKLCRELAPPPVLVAVPPDPELVCRKREWDQNAVPILASEAALPLHEPGREA
jgi:hypothetical protein